MCAKNILTYGGDKVGRKEYKVIQYTYTISSTFEKEWLKVFAKTINKNELDKYVTHQGNYIWHIFSWKLLPEGSFLAGNEARKAFDEENKTNARYYEPWPDNGQHNPEYNSPSSKELDLLRECYVISSDKKWTYIKTHEGDFHGPYFYKLGKK